MAFDPTPVNQSLARALELVISGDRAAAAVALVEHVVGHAMGEPGRELLSELEGMPSRGQPQ